MFSYGMNSIRVDNTHTLTYNYAGIFWFGFAWNPELHETDRQGHFLRNAKPSELSLKSARQVIPLNDRFGWLIWAVAIVVNIIC